MQSSSVNNSGAKYSEMNHGRYVQAGQQRCMGCMRQYNSQLEYCPYCGYSAHPEVENLMHLYPGTILQGRYLVGKVLGYGGFGTTYLAWDYVLQKERAIKEYLPSEFSTRAAGQSKVTVFSGDKTKQFSDGLERFVEEAKKLAKVHNESGIVKIYDSFEENNTAYIVMEHLDGETLAQFIAREKTVPAEKAIEMLMPVMQSLQRVHAQGILHRDIAPDNIFLTKEGEIKLIDFGAARFATTSKSRSLTVIIKPGFSAEEQYRSKGDQGPHTDVYSLGATLYKMITGVNPPDALERRAYYERDKKDILSPITKYVKDINPNIETAIYNAMNIRLEDRTSTIEQFARELLSETKVKRRKGTLKQTEKFKWPLWVKIGAPLLLVTVIALSVLLGFGIIGPRANKAFSDNIPKGQTRVPDIVAQDFLTAGQTILDSNLEIRVINRMESDTVDENMILIQTPEAGSIVDEGTIVYVTISAGRGTDFVIDVRNFSKDLAKTKLEGLGFKVRYKEEYDDTVAPGSVISQSVKGGTELETGEEITLVISKGKQTPFADTSLEMPYIEGKTFEEARRLLIRDGVYLIIDEVVYSQDYPEGEIFYQSVSTGTVVNSGDVIGVTVSLGLHKTNMPNVIHRSGESAINKLKAKGLVVKVEYTENKDYEAGTVISQSIEAGEEVLAGEEVTIFVCKGKESKVPDVVNMHYDDAQSLLMVKGLTPKIIYQQSSTVAKNYVISQSIEEGKKIQHGTVIEIVVSCADEPVPQPQE